MKWLCALAAMAAAGLAILALMTASAGFFGFLVRLASVLVLAFAALGGLGAAAKPPGNPGMALVGVLIVIGLGILLMVATPRRGLSGADQTPWMRVAAKPADDVPVPHIEIEKPRKTPPQEIDTVNIGHVLGHWITPLQPTSAQFLTIRERNGVYEVVLQLFHGRSPIVSRLRTRPSSKGRRFDAVGDAEGTYYILQKNGDLDIWDEGGEFLVAKRYEGPTDPASIDKAVAGLWDWAACRNDASCEGDRYRSVVTEVCPDLIGRQARYDIRWTNHIFEGRFLPIVQWHGRDGRKKGLIDFAGDKVQFQNGFGAWQNYYYICTFDIAKNQIIQLKLRPGRLGY